MEFSILHHSYRYKTTSDDNKYGKWDYIVYNLVFTAYDSHLKQMCLDLAAEWKRVLVAKDKDKAVQAINKHQLNARSALGQEATLSHFNAYRRYTYNPLY